MPDPTAATTSGEKKPEKALHVVLWVVQAVLASMFGIIGVLKTTTPTDELEAMLPWVASAPGLARFIGASELLAAVGLVLPAGLRIRPTLTAYAAAGIVVIMLLATAFHIYRAEVEAVPITLALGSLAGFVVWGRLRRAPIAPRR